MIKLQKLALLTVTVLLLTWMTHAIQGKETKQRRALPQVFLPHYDELVLITPQHPLRYSVTRASVSFTETKSLTLRFNDLPASPTVTVSTYLATAGISVEKQSLRLKELVRVEVLSGNRQHNERLDFVKIQTRNHLKSQPLEIIVTSAGNRMRFLWWTTGGPLEPLAENFCMESDGTVYSYDKQKMVWLLAHPDTIERHLRKHTLMRTIRQ